MVNGSIPATTTESCEDESEPVGGQCSIPATTTESCEDESEPVGGQCSIPATTTESCEDESEPVGGQCSIPATTTESCEDESEPVGGQCTVEAECAFGEPTGPSSNVCHKVNDDCPEGYEPGPGGNCRTDPIDGSCPPGFNGETVTPQGQNCNTDAQCPGDPTDASSASTCVYDRECPDDSPPSGGQCSIPATTTETVKMRVSP